MNKLLYAKPQNLLSLARQVESSILSLSHLITPPSLLCFTTEVLKKAQGRPALAPSLPRPLRHQKRQSETPSVRFYLLLILCRQCPTEDVLRLFKDRRYIRGLDFYQDYDLQHKGKGKLALLSFQSRQRAERTFNSLKDVDFQLIGGETIYWVNGNKVVVGQAFPSGSGLGELSFNSPAWNWTVLLPEEEQPKSSQCSRPVSEQPSVLELSIRRLQNSLRCV